MFSNGWKCTFQSARFCCDLWRTFTIAAGYQSCNYHQSEEIHLAVRARRCHCADRHLNLKLTFPVFWVIFQILLRGKSKISAGKFSLRRLLKPFEVLISFWASVNSFIVAGFNLLHSDLKKLLLICRTENKDKSACKTVHTTKRTAKAMFTNHAYVEDLKVPQRHFWLCRIM